MPGKTLVLCGNISGAVMPSRSRQVVLFVAVMAFVMASVAPCAAETPRLFFVTRDGKSFLVDATGRVVAEPAAVAAWGYAEGRFVVSNGTRLGFADVTGRTVIAPRFQWAEAFHDGLARVELPRRGASSSLCGFVDRSGRLVIPAIYRAANDFREDRAVVITASGYSFIDREGRVAIAGPFDQAGDFSQGLAPVMRAYRWGYVDRSGRLQIPYQFDGAGGFRDGLAPVFVRERREFEFNVAVTGAGYVDGSGRMVIAPRFSSAEEFSDGLALVTEGSVYVPSMNHLGRELAVGKRMFIDRTGAVVFACDTNVLVVRSFREGLAYAEYSDGRKGFLDRTGKMAIVLESSAVGAGDFDSGIARVRFADGREGLIDRTGAYVWAPTK
ncbi:MAG TPA: WG repeat-containing protein [Blastocatellia bacterium]|nr:WG repeat-containing protein [Blastocatellia bacterium]